MQLLRTSSLKKTGRNGAVKKKREERKKKKKARNARVAQTETQTLTQDYSRKASEKRKGGRVREELDREPLFEFSKIKGEKKKVKTARMVERTRGRGGRHEGGVLREQRSQAHSGKHRLILRSLKGNKRGRGKRPERRCLYRIS